MWLPSAFGYNFEHGIFKLKGTLTSVQILITLSYIDEILQMAFVKGQSTRWVNLH